MKKKATISKSITFPRTVSFTVRELAGIKITIQSPRALYIHLNDHVYYIDDSTGEQIIEVHKQSEQE
jgi:hypothetical protein